MTSAQRHWGPGIVVVVLLLARPAAGLMVNFEQPARVEGVEVYFEGSWMALIVGPETAVGGLVTMTPRGRFKCYSLSPATSALLADDGLQGPGAPAGGRPLGKAPDGGFSP